MTVARSRIALLAGAALSFAASLSGQVAAPADSVNVRAIAPPTAPLPPENATASITKYSFIAYGDTRGEFDGTLINSAHLSVVQSMLRNIRLRAGTDSAIKFVVQSGDAVVDGRQAKMLNVSYVPVIEQITTIANIPYYLAVGNHDVFSNPSLTDSSRVKGLRNYFAANAKLIPEEGSPRRLTGYPTYAVGYGNTFIIFYDSQIAGDSVQYDWVRRQLEGLDTRRYVNIVAVSHVPTFSSGPHGASNIEPNTAIVRERYMPLFHKHHVKLLVTGHEHFFEHWVERYQDSTGTHRLDQIVTGGGGAPLYGYQGEPALTDYLTKNAASRVRLEHLVRPAVDPGANPFHYVIVHVDGAKIRLEVVAPSWGASFAPYRTNKVDLTP
jgi:hypothetical protein